MLLLLLLVVLSRSCSASVLPKWTAAAPNASLPNDGYPIVPGAKHAVIYQGNQSTFGGYNHGPIVIHHGGVFYITWYNGFHGEGQENRVLAATSTDGTTWSDPAEVFPAVHKKNQTSNVGLESEPFALLGDNLYLAAASWDIFERTGPGAEHTGREVLMLRRVHGPGSYGPIFWLTTDVPSGYEWYNFPVYTGMDATTRADAARYLASLVNVTPPTDFASPNERSLYALPGRPSELVLLMRAGESHAKRALLASMCTLPSRGEHALPAREATTRACRPGTGIINANKPLDIGNVSPDLVEDIQACQWSTGAYTSIPDSHTRTCASTLPDGTVYLVGSQIYKSRNPLTISTSQDGLSWSKAWTIRGDAQHKPDYAYPGAVWVDDTMYVAYSIDKHDIAVTTFPLSSLTA